MYGTILVVFSASEMFRKRKLQHICGQGHGDTDFRNFALEYLGMHWSDAAGRHKIQG